MMIKCISHNEVGSQLKNWISLNIESVTDVDMWWYVKG